MKAKVKLFVGFRNEKVLAMVFTAARDYADAVDCDYFVLADEGKEKQRLETWLLSQQEKEVS